MPVMTIGLPERITLAASASAGIPAPSICDNDAAS
jgi:hypothetical protein